MAVILTSCGRTINSETNTDISTTAEDIDYLAVEQYKPWLPVVEASELSDDALADAEAKGNKKILKKFKFKDGKTYSYATVGDWVVEGNLLMAKVDEFEKQLQAMNEQSGSGEPSLSPQGAVLADVQRWPGGVVYVETSSLNIFIPGQREDIQTAMQIITDKTVVGFRLATSGNRIRFTNVNGDCSSYLGMVGVGLHRHLTWETTALPASMQARSYTNSVTLSGLFTSTTV